MADFTKVEKHDAVLGMLARLEKRLGRGAFQIVDHWEGDLDAIGVADPCNRELLAYIAVYASDDFYVELELPPQPGSELPYSVAGQFRPATFDELAQIVAKHLASGGLDSRERILA
ncbi:MAG: hypothetical protein ACLQOO_27295 [Terriglobia bacterium]